MTEGVYYETQPITLPDLGGAQLTFNRLADDIVQMRVSVCGSGGGTNCDFILCLMIWCSETACLLISGEQWHVKRYQFLPRMSYC